MEVKITGTMWKKKEIKGILRINSLEMEHLTQK